MRVRWKFLDMAYNQRESRDKRSLGRNPDRSWCYRHTSVKFSWSQPIDPWTSAQPWAATKKALHWCDCDTSSCPGSYPTAACPEFHVAYRLGRELFRPPSTHIYPYLILSCCKLVPFRRIRWIYISSVSSVLLRKPINICFLSNSN